MDTKESITNEYHIFFEYEGKIYYFYLSELLCIVQEMIDQEIDENEIKKELKHLTIFQAR